MQDWAKRQEVVNVVVNATFHLEKIRPALLAMNYVAAHADGVFAVG